MARIKKRKIRFLQLWFSTATERNRPEFVWESFEIVISYFSPV